MHFVLLLQQMAETYGLLPSEVIQRATTFDMVMMDIAMTYRNAQEERARTGHRDPSSYRVEDLMKIKEQARAASEKDRSKAV